MTAYQVIGIAIVLVGYLLIIYKLSDIWTTLGMLHLVLFAVILTFLGVENELLKMALSCVMSVALICFWMWKYSNYKYEDERM